MARSDSAASIGPDLLSYSVFSRISIAPPRVEKNITDYNILVNCTLILQKDSLSESDV